MSLYHEKVNSTSEIDRFQSFYAYVEKETSAGCMVSLQLDGGFTSPAFAFGNFHIGDLLLVSVSKIFSDDRYPRVSVDAVISYASDFALGVV